MKDLRDWRHDKKTLKQPSKTRRETLLQRKKMSKWEVELLVSSKCKIDGRMSFLAEKGDHDPFFSKVEIENYYNSLSINIQANADSEEDATDAGFYFIGQALNYMSWRTKSPFELYAQLEQAQLRKRTSAKQVLDKEAWEKAFSHGRRIHIENSKLAMSLGWYRKSLNNEDRSHPLRRV